MSVPVVFAIVGVISFFIGIWGSEIKIKEIEIPHATNQIRIVFSVVGLILILASIRMSLPVSTSNLPDPQSETESPILVTSTPIIATAVITETPTITPAATLTVEEQSMELLSEATRSWKLEVLDNFSENTYNWRVGERKSGDELDVTNSDVNGRYHIDVMTGNGAAWYYFSSILTPKKFYLATDARRTTTQPGCVMALIWSTTNGYYFYQINDNEKYYDLEVYDGKKEEGERWNNAVPETTSSLIRSQEINRMAVINDGTYIWLYLNDQFLNRVEAEYESEGEMGYFVSVCESDVQVTFEFDNFELRTPRE